MARGRTQRVMTRRIDESGASGRRPDDVVVEEPMEIHLDGTLVATTMRTPGHDYELAVGFCHGDGLLRGAPVTSVRYCATGTAVDTRFNVVSVDTDGVAAAPTPRLGTTTSSCGLCGSTQLEALTGWLEPVEPVDPTPSVLRAVADAVHGAQELFAATGGLHAAAAFDPTTAEVLVVREDIGRHNAVDKVVGRLLLDGRLPASGLGLWVSGRASFEMVQKAWAAGFGALVSVSAASSLAVSTAAAANLRLLGFARDGGAVNYSA